LNQPENNSFKRNSLFLSISDPSVCSRSIRRVGNAAHEEVDTIPLQPSDESSTRSTVEST